MSSNPSPMFSLPEAWRTLVRLRWFLIVPAVVCGGLAAATACVLPRYWQASLGLVIRQEAAGSADRRPGQFADLYEMRTLQETILELAKSRQVVEGTLAAVGGAGAIVDDEQIEEFRDHLKMLPPNGAEFGKTEVFYFVVKDEVRARAIGLVTELCHQLEQRLQQLREERGRSLTAEMEQQVRLAAEVHEAESTALKEFEASVGADLGELRLLHSASPGQSDLRLQSVTLEADARRYEAQARDAGRLLELLSAAQENPDQIVTVPSTLLSSQPALKRLKDGLVDAQLATARLRGTRSEDHPRVEAAIEAENRIRLDLHAELAAAIENAAADRNLANERHDVVAAELAGVQERLNRLAEARATYSNFVAAVDDSRTTLNRARQKLSAARATIASAHTTSLVAALDKAETGPYPEGPGKATIAAAGAIGGFMLGLGGLMLLVGPTLGRGPGGTVPATSSAAAEKSPLDLAADVSATPLPLDATTTRVKIAPLDPLRTAAAQPLAAERPSPPRSEWWEHPRTAAELEQQAAAAAASLEPTAEVSAGEKIADPAAPEVETANPAAEGQADQEVAPPSSPERAAEPSTIAESTVSSNLVEPESQEAATLPENPWVLPSSLALLKTPTEARYQGQSLEQLIESLVETR